MWGLWIRSSIHIKAWIRIRVRWRLRIWCQNFKIQILPAFERSYHFIIHYLDVEIDSNNGVSLNMRICIIVFSSHRYFDWIKAFDTFQKDFPSGGKPWDLWTHISLIFKRLWRYRLRKVVIEWWSFLNNLIIFKVEFEEMFKYSSKFPSPRNCNSSLIRNHLVLFVRFSN